MRIAIIGDFNPAKERHRLLSVALDHAAAADGLSLTSQWIGTQQLGEGSVSILESYDGVLCAPGSPYRNLEGALAGLRWVRETDRPFLGLCAGFQHSLLEIARNVAGLEEVQHAEYTDTQEGLLIERLACSLVDVEELVTFAEGSLVASLYGDVQTMERYFCNFSLNPRYRGPLEEAGLRISGTDREGAARAAELPRQRFYVAALFQPQVRSSPQRPHPLFLGLVRAAAT